MNISNDENIGCVVCEDGRLSLRTYDLVLTYKGKELVIPNCECYYCDSCGCDPVFPDQIRRTEQRIKEAKEQVDKLNE